MKKSMKSYSRFFMIGKLMNSRFLQEYFSIAKIVINRWLVVLIVYKLYRNLQPFSGHIFSVFLHANTIPTMLFITAFQMIFMSCKF